MERSIVHAFKRLRVLTPNFKFRGNMDDLVNDLSHALEESSSSHIRSGMKIRRRRGRKRRSKLGNTSSTGMDIGEVSKHRSTVISEDSESSLDLSSVSRYYSYDKDFMCIDQDRMNVSTLSDTDDLNLIHRFKKTIKIPSDANDKNIRKPSSGMSFESDSVNENFSPVRPHRRRRKFKRMDTDSQCATVNNNSVNVGSGSSDRTDEFVMLTCGKRKRSSRERSLEIMDDCKMQEPIQPTTSGHMLTSESSVSSLSSSESDTDLMKRDEGREADDEQSDFFFESGPSSGIPGVKSWWDKTDDSEEADPKLEQILHGCFDHSTQNTYHYSLQRLKNMQNRDIRTGHRRLNQSRKPQVKAASIDEIIEEFINDPNQNELWLPPLSKKEKEKLLNLAPFYQLKIKCQGHGPKKRAFLVKTLVATSKLKLASDDPTNIQNNNVILSDIKRRKKTPSEITANSSNHDNENQEFCDVNWQASTSTILDDTNENMPCSSFQWPNNKDDSVEPYDVMLS